MSKKIPTREWPTFRGRSVSVKEATSGLIITPFYNDAEPQTFHSSFIPRNQVWIGRGARVFLELRFGQPPLETHGNISTLTGSRFRELDAEIQSIHEEVGKRSAGTGQTSKPSNTPPGYLSLITFKKVAMESIRPGASF